MKTKLLFLSLFFVINYSFSQNIFNGNVDLATQSEVEAFGDNDYTEITGSLRIETNSILSLSTLSTLTIIGNDLWIRGTSLSNLNGLQNITSIGDELRISDNLNLQNIDGLNSTSSVNGHLFIENNSSLENIDGLINITSVNLLLITNNDVLLNLNGLSNISSIGNHLSIDNNDSLTNLNGLGSINNIPNSLLINNNDSLISLFGISQNFTSVGLSIDISNNNALKNLEGLNNITTVGLDLKVRFNDALENLNGLNGVISVGDDLFILSNPLLDNINSLSKLYSVGTQLAINDNNLLSNLEGLINLYSVGGNLGVINNTNLIDFCGLNKLIINNNLIGTYSISNNLYNPTQQDLINNNCSGLTPSLELLYPKFDDYYIEGENIRIQFLYNSNIPNGSDINVLYSIDLGQNWITDISYQYSNNTNGVFFIAPNVSTPTEVMVKVNTTTNGVVLEYVNPIFTVQPIDYYGIDGFYNSGISLLNFPLQGLINDNDGWNGNIVSPLHNCLDANSQDWNYYNSVKECGKDVRAPFYGKIIYIHSDVQTNNCGENTNPSKYGTQIVIQSLTDKTLVFRIAHLKELNSNLSVGVNVNVGDIIGKVGGSGTLFVHAHISFYKNIYSYVGLDYSESGLGVVYTIKELLEIGKSLTNTDFEFCQDFESKYSAEFSFINDNSVSLEDNVLPTLDSLLQFISFSYTSINLNLLIGTNNSSSSYKRQQSVIINSLDGLETILSIDGNLTISETNITNLDGLQNLTHVGGDVIIKNNSLLSNFCGLYSLVENNGIGGNLIINGNTINPSSEEILNSLDCDSTLSVSHESINYFDIYPNPTYNIVNIKNIQNVDVKSISLFDVLGNKIVVRIGSDNTISLKNLSEGIYFIKIKFNKKVIIKRIIKRF